MIGRAGRPGLIATAARTAVIAGTAQAVTGAVANKQAQARAAQHAAVAEPAAPAQQDAPPPASPAGGGDDLLAQLERLAQLHAAGVLSDAEFGAAKAKLLG